jgi:hypothetical protein
MITIQTNVPRWNEFIIVIGNAISLLELLTFLK